MAPPPAATPSSNRFIFKKPGATPPSGADQQSQINREGDIETSASVPRQPVAQFAAIPRFSAPRTRAVRASSYPPRSPSPSKLDFATPREAPTLQPKVVQNVGSGDNENDDEEMLDNEIGPVNLGHFSPVTTDAITPQQDQPKEIAPTPSMFPPSSKRPRLMQPSYPSGSQQPSKPGASRFIVPVSPSSSHLSRPSPFLVSPSLTQASATSESGVTDSPSRPAFLKPSLPHPDANAAPLPEAFSPHRRGNRHVPGGMAAELSSWILEAGQAAVAGRRGKGYLQGNDFVRKIKATRTRAGDGAVFLEGIDGEGVETRLVLAGGGEKKEKVSEGETIGIREPSWEVIVEGHKWVIGADWRVVRR